MRRPTRRRVADRVRPCVCRRASWSPPCFPPAAGAQLAEAGAADRPRTRWRCRPASNFGQFPPGVEGREVPAAASSIGAADRHDVIVVARLLVARRLRAGPQEDRGAGRSSPSTCSCATTVPIQLFLFPLYFGFAQARHLLGNMFAPSLIYAAINMPLAVMLCGPISSPCPQEIEEAALVDGANTWQCSAQGHAAAGVARASSPSRSSSASIAWNEFLIASTFLQGDSSMTATLGYLSMNGTYATDRGEMMAGAFILVVPDHRVLLLLQRHFIDGMAGGAVKGRPMNVATVAPADYAEAENLCRRARQADRRLSRPSRRGLDLRGHPEQLGEVEYYVNDGVELPLVVTDDDISGTFAFYPRARGLRHRPRPQRRGDRRDLAQLHRRGQDDPVVGRHRPVHRAHRLPAPASAASPRRRAVRSSSTARTIAEQIGAQIFIDAWAMVNPGDPERAAAVVREAASVSHDGIAVEAAAFLGAMRALAFDVADLDGTHRPVPWPHHLAAAPARHRRCRRALRERRTTGGPSATPSTGATATGTTPGPAMWCPTTP